LTNRPYPQPDVQSQSAAYGRCQTKPETAGPARLPDANTKFAAESLLGPAHAAELADDRFGRDRSQLLSVLRSRITACAVDLNSRVLVVGAGVDDLSLLSQAGFTDITLSNLSDHQIDESIPQLRLDAQALDLPDESYDLVFAHAVLHHCRSPHRAFCEMLRVARRYVFFVEPNDSFFMRLLVRLRFSLPHEVAAVIGNDFQCGGVDNTTIPNFLYRWNRNEVLKTASSCVPERRLANRSCAYWDFFVNEADLAARKGTRLHAITNLIGAGNFIRSLKAAQGLLNLWSPLRSQGNKFFGAVVKQKDLQPWLKEDSEGIAFDRQYGAGV
jgi:SAM-dependent methyltransferase